MIDREELAICKKRGHYDVVLLVGDKWTQCAKCGTWLRKVTTIEEREEEPPEDDQSILNRPKKGK